MSVSAMQNTRVSGVLRKLMSGRAVRPAGWPGLRTPKAQLNERVYHSTPDGSTARAVC